MSPQHIWALVALLLCSLAAVAYAWTDSDDSWTVCVPHCKCFWQNGRKSADCRSGGHSGLPRNLSAEIRSLDLSDNPIYELGHDSFAENRDLQKLRLSNCSLLSIDRDAFKNMSLLIELDLSRNNLKRLHPATFLHLTRLRLIFIRENSLIRLEDYMFHKLDYLQTIDLSHNLIQSSGLHTFDVKNVRKIHLNNNSLTYFDVYSINRLEKLSAIDFHDNPWICNCTIRELREYLLKRNLYTNAIECNAPERIKGRTWRDLSANEFACPPQVQRVSLVSELRNGENATLTCVVHGDPTPSVKWEFGYRVVDTDSRKRNNQKYLVSEGKLYDSDFHVNLTIINVKRADRGLYTCVGANPAGESRGNITLSAEGIVSADGDDDQKKTLTFILLLGLVVGIAFLMLILLVCYCVTRRNTGSQIKNYPKGDGPNGDVISLNESGAEEKSLINSKAMAINPLTKPPRQPAMQPSAVSAVTEVSDANKNLLDSDSIFANEDENRSFDSLEGITRRPAPIYAEHGLPSPTSLVYPPDLLAFGARAAQPSPVGSSTSTVPDHSRLPGPQSPASVMYGTLPLSRSQSPYVALGPIVTPRHHQGYVTIPRQPRVPSWSSQPPLSPEISEPVYDNLGKRTTADGSSKLSLNKAGLDSEFTSTPLTSAVATLPRAPRVPPQPPPKPNKKPVRPAETLYEDEGADGTEV